MAAAGSTSSFVCLSSGVNQSSPIILFPCRPKSHFIFNLTTTTNVFLSNWRKPSKTISVSSPFSSLLPLKSRKVEERETTHAETSPIFSDINSELLPQLVYEALVWSSLHGLVVGDKNVQRSGTVPGVGMVHSPLALLPMSFPRTHWEQACELAPLFNELVDRVSLDGEFLQDSLSRTKKVDAFTRRLLNIHSKMLEINKKEEIRLGLHRSDYMLDAQTNALLQIELNTISTSSIAPGCLVSELHRNLLNKHGKHLGLDSRRIPHNTTVSWYAEALAKAWNEYNNPRAVVLIVVQIEEHNMYDQHWLLSILNERYPFNLHRYLLPCKTEGSAK